MTKLARRFGALALATAFAAVTGAAASAQEFTLKLHHLLGPKAPAQTQMLEPWVKRIEDGTNGRVKIDIYPAMSLGGAPPQLVSQVRDGVVDLVWTVNGYTAGLFPRTEVFELPFIHVNNPAATNQAMFEMFDEYLAEEYKGVKVMFLHVHAGQAIQTVDKEIRKPADFEGLKMRIPTRTGAWIIEALGAAPVGMPVPDLPQALSKKVVDGAFIPWEIIAPLGLPDLVHNYIEGPDMSRFGTTTFQVSMNEGTWNSLPADIQKVFVDNSGADWWKEVGDIWINSDKGGIGIALKKPENKHVVLSQDEYDAFRAPLEPVVQRWVDEVTAKGVDGAGLVAKARELIAKYNKASM